MVYSPKTDWADAPATTSPITAAELIRIENGIAAVSTVSETDATETQKGRVELASAAEMTTGTDTTRPASVKRIVDYVASVLSAAAYATQAYVDAKVATPLTLVASSAAVVPLTVKSAASQTANVFQVSNSAGTIIGSIDKFGQFNAGANVAGQGMFKAQARGATIPVAVFKAADSQTADIVDVQDNNGVVKMSIAFDGKVNGPNIGLPVALLSPTDDPAALNVYPGSIILRSPA